MAAVKKIVLIEHPANRMFDLVDRVEDYPLFLPWCGGSDLLQRTPQVTKATIHINYHGIKASFTTENDKEYPKHMLIRLVNGPFRQLDGDWRFTQLGEKACKIEFGLRWEFATRILDTAIGPVFNHIANTFVEAFVKRADQMKL